MSEFWTYRLQDLLLFSPRVYWRMFELQNAAVWPLQPIAILAGVAATIMVLQGRRFAGVAVGAILAVLWAFVGWSFLWGRYSAINWAMAYVAPAFILQAILLAGSCAWKGSLAFDRTGRGRNGGLLLAAAAIGAYPLLPLFFGRPAAGAEIFGVAPDPTAIATLGFLLASRGRHAPLLYPIPLAWLLLSGLTLHTLRDAQAWLPFLAIAATLGALLLRSR
jgi:Family of unknown function (DUF6064)